jgi:hypothetical protein
MKSMGPNSTGLRGVFAPQKLQLESPVPSMVPPSFPTPTAGRAHLNRQASVPRLRASWLSPPKREHSSRLMMLLTLPDTWREWSVILRITQHLGHQLESLEIMFATTQTCAPGPPLPGDPTSWNPRANRMRNGVQERASLSKLWPALPGLVGSSRRCCPLAACQTSQASHACTSGLPKSQRRHAHSTFAWQRRGLEGGLLFILSSFQDGFVC